MNKLSNKKIYNIILILGISMFLLINTLFIQLAAKTNLSVDLTDTKLYQLSTQTMEVLEDITQNISITVLANEQQYPPMIKELLVRYAQQSKNVQVQYADPYANPMLIDHYRQLGYNIAENDIIVKKGDTIKHIAYNDILVYSGAQITGIKFEQLLTSALLYLDTDTQLTAMFSLGHNETISSSLENLFSSNNYEVEQGIISKDITSDVLVIASPTNDFTSQEINILNEYMDNDGTIIVFLEPSTTNLKNLELFLKKWNLAVENNVIFEEKAYMSNNPLNIVPMYVSHEINEYFSTNEIYTVMPSARSLTILDESMAAIQTSPLLMSTSDSYAKKDIQYQKSVKEEQDEMGPFVVSAISQKIENGQSKGNLIVNGSKNFYANDIMNVSSYANGQFLSQVLNYVNENVSHINIAPKTIVLPPLTIKLNESKIIGFTFAIAIPAMILLYGIYVVVKRKKQ